VLLSRGHVPLCDAIGVIEYRRYFDEKVAGVYVSTSDAPLPTFSSSPPGCQLLALRSLTTDDVVTAVRAMPDRQSTSDPLPTCLLKNNVNVFAPFLVQLY